MLVQSEFIHATLSFADNAGVTWVNVLLRVNGRDENVGCRDHEKMVEELASHEWGTCFIECLTPSPKAQNPMLLRVRIMNNIMHIYIIIQ